MTSNEDPTKTKMDISVQVFNDVLTSEAIKTRPHITLLLFLNKIDLLQAKLNNDEDRERFQQLFPDFQEGMDSACSCVEQRFVSPFPEYQIYAHYICALDTTLMEEVFKAVRQTIFDNRLSSSGVKV